MGPPAYMQSVVDQTVVMRCIPALSVCLFVSHSVVTAHTYHLDCSDIRPWVRLACLLTLERVLQETPRHSTCPQRYCWSFHSTEMCCYVAGAEVLMFRRIFGVKLSTLLDFGLPRGVNKIYALLGCYAAQIVFSYPTFRDNINSGCPETSV